MKQKVWMVLLLILIGSVSAALLNWVYSYTAPIVARNTEIKLRRSVLNVLKIPYAEDTIDTAFGETVRTEEKSGLTVYKSYEGDRLDGVAFRSEGSGFWAPISALIALEPDLETVKGVTVVEQAETPGLGGRISEPWFQEQFSGKKLRPSLHVVPYREASGPNEVDAITGATETSRAFDRLLNEGIQTFYEIADELTLEGEER